MPRLRWNHTTQHKRSKSTRLLRPIASFYVLEHKLKIKRSTSLAWFFKWYFEHIHHISEWDDERDGKKELWVEKSWREQRKSKSERRRPHTGEFISHTARLNAPNTKERDEMMSWRRRSEKSLSATSALFKPLAAADAGTRLCVKNIWNWNIFFVCAMCIWSKNCFGLTKKNAANQRLDDKRLNTRQRGPHTSAARLGSLKRSLSLISSETLLCGNCAAIKNEILMGKDPLLSRFYVAFPYTAAEQL